MIFPLSLFSLAIIMAFAIVIGVIRRRHRHRHEHGSAHARLEDGNFKIELHMGDVKEE